MERKKKSPKSLENFHGYSASKEHHPKNVEDSFRKVYYEAYDFVIAAIRKRFDQLDYQMHVAMQNILLMSCNGKDPKQEINRGVNGDISFASLYSEETDMSKLMSQLKLLPSLFRIKDNGTIDMSTIIKKLQDMSRNRRFLISEVEKIVRLLLLSPATNAESERIFSALKRVKTYLRSTMGSNRLHALMLMHVHKNILNKINLANVANEFVNRRDSQKQTFGYFSQNDS